MADPESRIAYVDQSDVSTVPVQRKSSRSTESLSKEKLDTNEKHHHPVDTEIALAKDTEEVELARARRATFYARFRPFILAGVALVIIGWWISATVLKATRHRW